MLFPTTMPTETTEIVAIDARAVREGLCVRRRPCGRSCTIDRVSDDRQKVLIHDHGHRFWLRVDTLVKDWY